jgi:MoaA/NifB/PqqE/SkfB family radical SAM enzyme
VISQGLQRIVRAVGRAAFTDSDRLMSQVEASPSAPVRPYSEARALIAKARTNAGWQVTNFSVNLGVAPCNHTCLFCPQSVQKPKKARWLDMDLLRKVLNEMPEEGIQIGLSSYSETIAAPNVVEAVKLMKQVRPKLRTAMASNGTLFRQPVIEQLMDAGLDQYSYSFDGATREDYATLMQKDDFDRVWENLEKLVELRARKNSKMVITTHIMGFQGKEADFETFKAYWEDKLDFVQWRTVTNWGGDNWGLEDRLARAGFVAAHRTPEKRYPCLSILHHFKMQWDGRYYPCVAAVPDYTREEENHCVPELGDAHEITWGEAWERLEAMRQAHLEGRWDEYEACRSCNVWGAWDNAWRQEAGADGSRRFVVDD